MKKVLLLMVVALGMSATSFAGEKKDGKDWKIDVNAASLCKYLNTNSNQYEAISNISELFADKVRCAESKNEELQAKRLRKAVYTNLKLMKGTLSDEQYKKYVSLMNITLRNKGLDTCMYDLAIR